VSTRPDPSDAGISWFIATGDEECSPAKLQQLLERHEKPPVKFRRQVRLEAENFRHLDGFEVEYRNDKKASQSLEVALTKNARGWIATQFNEPYAPDSGSCAMEVRYLDESGTQSRFTLLLNGKARGTAWASAGDGRGWTTHTVSDVAIRAGDEIAIEAEGNPCRLDYVQLNFAGATGAPP
jgi:hypothetical protein